MHFPKKLIFFLIVLSLMLTSAFSENYQVKAQEDNPGFLFPLAAPWPAGVILHSGGDGYGYDQGTHGGSDLYAMDFNGSPNEDDTSVEHNDKDLLVLAVADGCVKKVEYVNGHYKDGKWIGNYGWNVVIEHVGGFESRYAHLKDKMILPTAISYDTSTNCYFVSQGQPIGQIGGTGTENSSAVHLHFAMYYCKQSNNRCSILSVKPEPLDGVNSLGNRYNPVKVVSKNYSVGYEAITGDALTNYNLLKFHKLILNEYKAWGGQNGFFGRVAGPVKQFNETNFFYQEFKPHALMSTYSAVILENNSQAFVLPGPIWDSYKNNYSQYGSPVTTTYVAQTMENEAGWRTDFQNASLFWDWSRKEPMVWNHNNAPWEASFCQGIRNYGCSSVIRLDPYIDFSFANSNHPGPLRNVHGFSAWWQASFDENLVSKIELEYEVQGNARFYIDDKSQSNWINSEDGVIQGVTSPSWHVGENTFLIRFWQSPGKLARLSIKVHEASFGIIKEVYAFESQGVLKSLSFQPPEVEYINFEPPPYPNDVEIPETLVPTESPPVELTPSVPELPTIELPNIKEWWQDFVKEVEETVDDWWREFTEDLQNRLEEELIKMMNEFLESLARQCSGSFILISAVITVTVLVRSKNHNRKM